VGAAAGAAEEAGEERTSAEAAVEEVPGVEEVPAVEEVAGAEAVEEPSGAEAQLASVAGAWEVWVIAVHSPAVETSDPAAGTLAVEAMTSHKVAGSMTVAGSTTDGTIAETDFSSVFRFMTTAITMIMDTMTVAGGSIEEQFILAARTGGAATNSA
jgi:hypothetical protein